MGVKLFEPKSGPAKGKSKFETLIVKIFCLKQKANQILTAAIEKVKFFLFKETIYGSSRQVIIMKKRKTKAIQVDLTIFTHIPAYSHLFRHNQAYSGIIQAYSGIFRILCNSANFIYAIYGCKCSSKNCVPLRNGSPQLLLWNKETLFSERTCSLQLITITYKEKLFLRNNCSTLGHSLFLWVFTYYFTKIFVHLSAIAAVCYFSVYKLIGWDPANVYLFKVNRRTLEKGVNYVQS